MKNVFAGIALLLSCSLIAQSNPDVKSQMNTAFVEGFKDFDKAFTQMDVAFAVGFKDFDKKFDEAFSKGFAQMDSSFAAGFKNFNENFNTAFQMNELKDTTLTDPERAYLMNVLAETQVLYEKSVAGVTKEQAAFKPDWNRWSINEILEHIALAEIGIFTIVQGELQKPAEPSRRAEIKVEDEQIVKILTNRSGKAQSPEQIRPTGRFPNMQIAMGAFQKQHTQIIDFVRTTPHNLRERYWKHMATGVIDLYQSLILIAAHTQRHLLQLEEVKANLNYPK